MNVIIRVSNSVELELDQQLCQHIPVEGTWYIEDKEDCVSIVELEERIKNCIDISMGQIEISVYRKDGRAITDELPCEGTFLAIRK
jgi:hypothetical protein